jgi:hypothetical protein
MLTPEVQEAVDEIAASFSGATLVTVADGQGGAFITVDSVELGAPYAQPSSWLGFHITSACPYADVYPHFVRGDLSRADGKPLGEGMSPNNFPPPGAPTTAQMPPRPAVQISRRSNRRDSSGIETPLIKLLKVIKWLKSR